MMITREQILFPSTYRFLAVAIALFIIEMILFAYAQKPLSHASLCLLTLQLLQPYCFFRTSIVIISACFTSVIYYGSLIAPLGYIIPMLLLSKKMRHYCYHSYLHYSFLLLITLILKLALIDTALLKLPMIASYTFSTSFVTLLILTVLLWNRV